MCKCTIDTAPFELFTLGGGTLRLLLGFAVGGLLGDVFLHLLPESVEILKNTGMQPIEFIKHTHKYIYMCVFVFLNVQLASDAPVKPCHA